MITNVDFVVERKNSLVKGSKFELLLSAASEFALISDLEQTDPLRLKRDHSFI